MSQELWKAIPDHDGYEVSTLGRVRSVDRLKGGKAGSTHPVTGIILSQRLDGYGYARVTMSTNGRRSTRLVHQLVLEAFVGPRQGRVGCHWDGAIQNNRLANLRWASQRENMADLRRHRREALLRVERRERRLSERLHTQYRFAI